MNKHRRTAIMFFLVGIITSVLALHLGVLYASSVHGLALLIASWLAFAVAADEYRREETE
jgi:hypothetical protein